MRTVTDQPNEGFLDSASAAGALRTAVPAASGRSGTLTERDRAAAVRPARRHPPASGTGSGRFSTAAAITSGKRSGVQANAGTPSAASAAACSRS